MLAELERLPEKDRHALTLRYFEDKRGTPLGKALGCEPAAARQRVHRALDRLRTAMDARHDGERRAWASLLAPLGSLAAGSRSLAATAALLVTGAGLGLAGALTWMASNAPANPGPLSGMTPPAPGESPALATAGDPARAARQPLEPALGDRTVVESSGSGTRPEEPVVLASQRLNAFEFVDQANGAPVPGIRVRAWTDGGRLLEGRTDQRGWLELSLQGDERVLEPLASGPGFTSALHSLDPLELALTLRWEVVLRCTVLDGPGGEPVSDAVVEVTLPLSDADGELNTYRPEEAPPS